MNSVKEFPFFRINDIAIPLILVIALLLLSSDHEADKSSEYHLEVHTASETLQFQIKSDTVFTVMGNIGEMEISIENERARIVQSPCPGQDCVRRGWLSRPGDLAVCVPSGVFIIISGEDGSNSPDALSY